MHMLFIYMVRDKYVHEIHSDRILNYNKKRILFIHIPLFILLVYNRIICIKKVYRFKTKR